MMDKNEEILENNQEIYDKIYSANSGDLGTSINSLLDILNDNKLGRFKNIIYESEFKELYLPMLYNLYKARTPTERIKIIRSEWYTKWAELSRNFGEVDVVEDGTKDENLNILFTVPSIYGYTNMNEEAINSYTNKELEDSAFGTFSIGKLANNFLVRADGNRFIAHKFLERHLTNISKSDLVINNRREVALKWEELFNRYADILGFEKKVLPNKENAIKKEEKKEEMMNLDELGW